MTNHTRTTNTLSLMASSSSSTPLLFQSQTISDACSKIAMKQEGPIVWRMDTSRLWSILDLILQYDSLWHSKKNQAVFRGAVVGLGGRRTDDTENNSTTPIRAPRVNYTTSCYQNQRCRLVMMSQKSSLVNAKLSNTDRIRLPHSKILGLRGETVTLADTMGPLHVSEQLQYKALIWLDAQPNVVSSSLKWALSGRFFMTLLSRCVVLMPPPRYTSWFMEEWLQPYVHYVPIFPNLSNVEGQMEWILQHDEEAQEIAHKSSLWAQDLLFHPQAKFDNQEVEREILQRYMAHFEFVNVSGGSSI
eukprot:CAMPEP_0172454122 /NCGR_PEP_ID=MMETSP1065-20121228/11200_1 /TAXON_ID=265537 /ORGANISM="Amphiprora paludosa, Strain CCMP125" /LENGTH=302 /DNA_ID=CAMNT_0013206399 /DNA_START=46 /DNA_END=957 /DNA_ORIENTATION=+